MNSEDLRTVGPLQRKSTPRADGQFGYTFARLHYDTNDNLFALYVYSFTANKERLFSQDRLYQTWIAWCYLGLKHAKYFLCLSKTTGFSFMVSWPMHYITFNIRNLAPGHVYTGKYATLLWPASNHKISQPWMYLSKYASRHHFIFKAKSEVCPYPHLHKKIQTPCPSDATATADYW